MPSGALPTLPLPSTVTDKLLVFVSAQPIHGNEDPIASKIKQKRV
jgi:hypothetical protein